MNLVKETCLSHQTIGRRINDLGEDIEGKLKDYLSTCDHYSLALDESTDQGNTAQLVIFIRGIDENLNVTDEMLDLCHMKGTTTGRDIYMCMLIWHYKSLMLTEEKLIQLQLMVLLL